VEVLELVQLQAPQTKTELMVVLVAVAVGITVESEQLEQQIKQQV